MSYIEYEELLVESTGIVLVVTKLTDEMVHIRGLPAVSRAAVEREIAAGRVTVL